MQHQLRALQSDQRYSWLLEDAQYNNINLRKSLDLTSRNMFGHELVLASNHHI